MPFSTLLVEGRSLNQNSSTESVRTSSVIESTGNLPSHSLVLSSTPTSTPTPAPQFRPVMARRPPPSFNLKLVEAKMIKSRRKVEFQPIKQTFIELVDSTANIDFILSIARQRWAKEYALVTQDGLRIDNSPVTQGQSMTIFTLCDCLCLCRVGILEGT